MKDAKGYKSNTEEKSMTPALPWIEIRAILRRGGLYDERLMIICKLSLVQMAALERAVK